MEEHQDLIENLNEQIGEMDGRERITTVAGTHPRRPSPTRLPLDFLGQVKIC